MQVIIHNEQKHVYVLYRSKRPNKHILRKQIPLHAISQMIQAARIYNLKFLIFLLAIKVGII